MLALIELDLERIQVAFPNIIICVVVLTELCCILIVSQSPMNHTVLEILSCLAQSQASIQLDLLAFIQALVKLASHLALNLFNVEECKVVSGDEHWDFACIVDQCISRLESGAHSNQASNLA